MPRTYDLRGDLRVWLRVRDDGNNALTVTGLDFDPESFELESETGLSYEVDKHPDRGGRDLTEAELDELARRLHDEVLRWQLRKIEDSDGREYFDASL